MLLRLCEKALILMPAFYLEKGVPILSSHKGTLYRMVVVLGKCGDILLFCVYSSVLFVLFFKNNFNFYIFLYLKGKAFM